MSNKLPGDVTMDPVLSDKVWKVKTRNAIAAVTPPTPVTHHAEPSLMTE